MDYAGEVKKDNPTAFFKIDPATSFPVYNSEAYYSGIAFTDYSGNNRTATLSGYLSDSGYTNATPRFGKTAISFNALHPENLNATYRYRMPRILTDITPTELLGGSAWTLEIWQRQTQIIATNYNMEDILYIGNADNVGPPWHGLRLGAYFMEITGYDLRALSRSQTQRTGPFHLAWVYDGSSLSLYSNAVLVTAYSGSLSAFNMAVASNQRLSILYKGDLRSNARSAQSLGTFSNFAFYPSALSLARLNQHYQAGITASVPMRLPSIGVTTSLLNAYKDLR
jgi:hypothetical protein